MARVDLSRIVVFLRGCFEAGPSNNYLANNENEDVITVRSRIEAFLDGLYNNPIPISNPDSPGILTVGLARKYFFLTPESQLLWKHNAAQSKVMSQSVGDVSKLAGSIWDFYSDLERPGLSCDDQIFKDLPATLLPMKMPLTLCSISPKM